MKFTLYAGLIEMIHKFRGEGNKIWPS